MTARSALLALVLSVGCTARGPVSHTGAVEGGSGTRAKADEGRLASPGERGSVDAPKPEAVATARAAREETKAPPPPPVTKEPAERAPAAPAATTALGDKSQAPVQFGGLGLTGSAQGGGGLGSGSIGLGGSVAKRKGSVTLAAPTSRPMIAASQAPQQIPAPAPQEFDTEAYSRLQDNPFLLTRDAPLSTFSVDVDTASYSNMRRFVLGGRLPPADTIRVEEWVNYFSYDDPAPPPTSDDPVAIASEVTDCPWAPGHRLLRVALNTRPIAAEAVPPRNLVFLIDVSGSMQPENKLPLLKRGLTLLARELRPEDTLSIVVYAGASGLALPPTSGAEQEKILAALGELESGGSTNGAEGIELAYAVAQRSFKQGGVNRVILASDGDFNVGVTSEGALERLIEEKRKSGVFLTVLGFGEGNLKDATMEKLADKGNGQYAYIDDLAEARRVLVQQSGATLVTVAKDVKLQLEFNPTRVKSYRLVGYENRALAARDFNDDKKDAGEMGAGHHVTAFYEVIPATEPAAAAPPVSEVDPLKYQGARPPSAAAGSDELVTVKIRYKAPTSDTSRLLSRAVRDRVVPLADTSANLRFGAAVAQYALTLRGAPGMPRDRLSAARSLAQSALGADPRHERREFLALMDKAGRLQAHD